MHMAIVKTHCASLASDKFSIVGVLHMLNWKRPGISLAKQYVGEKNHQKKLYIFRTCVCSIYSLGYNYTSLESKKTDFE